MKKTLILTALTLAPILAVQASDKLSYEYVDFGYVHSEGELTSDKAGYKLGISESLSEHWYFKAGLQSQSADVWTDGSTADVTAQEYSLAVGFHVPTNRTHDFFMDIGYIKFDGTDIIPQSTYGNDDEGLMANLGLRGRLSTSWEYSVFAGYKDYDYSAYVNEALHEDSNSATYGVEGRYYFSKNWSFGINASQQITGLTSGFDFRYNL